MDAVRERLPDARTRSSSSFDPAAVPQVAQFPPAAWERFDEEDLTALGEEQLFTGTRRPRTQDPPETADSTSDTQRMFGALTPGVSDDCIQSLTAVEHSFVLALNSLLQQCMAEATVSGTETPPYQMSNGLLDSAWGHLSTLRRHSIATSASHSPVASPRMANSQGLDEDHNMLSSLVRRLRTRTSHAVVSSKTAPASSPRMGDISRAEALVDELASQVDALTAELPPIDADLATTMVSLLSCVERLLTLSEPTIDLSPPLSRNTEDNPFAADADAASVLSAVREVQRAERDLLWGRLDDLSDKVGSLCRTRNGVQEMLQEQTRQEDLQSRGDEHWKPAEARLDADESEGLRGDLPEYYDQEGNLPPAYVYDRKQSLEDSKLPSHDWEKPPPTPDMPSNAQAFAAGEGRIRQRQTSNLNSEKMQRDLDSVSVAIERLYLVAPQLANQRVEPDRRQQRERQLAKLGNAIERLSKGRLENQRAIPSPVIPEEPAERARRTKRSQDAHLDRLIEQIDRAASRTLADQRVELNGKRKEKMHEAKQDSLELERQQYILAHTGKGRLASQDAMSTTAKRESPLTIAEFFKSEQDPEEPRRRSNSSPVAPTLRKRFSGLFQHNAEDEQENRTPSMNGRSPSPNTASGSPGIANKKSLRLGMFKKATPTLSPRGSFMSEKTANGLHPASASMSRRGSTGLEVYSVSPLNYVAEEARNLGTITINFWNRSPNTTIEDYEVLAVEGDTMLVAPSSGGSASRLRLPVRAMSQTVTVTRNGDVHEAKLFTVPPSPTRARADLELAAPLSAKELGSACLQSFACAHCETEIVDASTITRYNALPSEHWAELLDAWMCHQDQTLSEDLMAKGKGIKPRSDEGLVASSYILLPREVTKNWVTADDSLGIRSESTNDQLFPAQCAVCFSLVGYHVKPLASGEASFVRILKYATSPVDAVAATESASSKPYLPTYSLASHLTTEMLETGQAHACHRFVVEDIESERVRLLLWIFNPAIRVSFLNASSTSSLLSKQDNSPDGDTSSLVSGQMNAVKHSLCADANINSDEFTGQEHSTTERLAYPLAITQRLVSLLRASSAVYPASKRTFGNMDAGFLERI